MPGINALDQILIRELHVRCIVGLKKEERLKQQDLILNVALYTDCQVAGRTDQIADTVDYSTIKKKVMSLVEESKFFLIESVAEHVAAICLDDPKVGRVKVSVDKPGALRFARSVAVEIERNRKM